MIRTVCDLIIELLKCSNAQVYIMYGHTTHNMSSGLIASSLFQRCGLTSLLPLMVRRIRSCLRS